MELLSVKIPLQNTADTAIIEVLGEPELCMAGKGFLSTVQLRKIFHIFYSQHNHHIHGCPIPTPTEHEQQPKETCNTDVEPPAKKPKHLGNAQMREARPWRAGKATAAAGRAAEPKGKMKWGENNPKLHRKTSALSRTAKVVS